MSVVFAASHPERVSAIVLYGENSRQLWAPDYPFGFTEREIRTMIEEGLDRFVTPGGIEEMVRSGLPSAGDDELRAWAQIRSVQACQFAMPPLHHVEKPAHDRVRHSQGESCRQAQGTPSHGCTA
jgi:hypothetical protein